jgi:hypothetical protein
MATFIAIVSATVVVPLATAATILRRRLTSGVSWTSVSGVSFITFS